MATKKTYCRRCGSELVETLRQDGIDGTTGKPLLYTIRKCPKYDGWFAEGWRIQPHDHFDEGEYYGI